MNNNNNYKKALKEISELEEEPIGFSNFTTSVPSNNIPIKQNNFIIQLLIDLLEKVDNIEEQLVEINQNISKISNSLPESLVDQLENLTLGKRKRKINPFDNTKWNFSEEKEKN